MGDKYVEERRQWDMCRDSLREVLKQPKYQPLHRWLQVKQEDALARILRESDMVSVAREQGVVLVLRDLIEELFPDNQA